MKAALIGLGALAAVSAANATETLTVSWYAAHPDIMLRVLRICRNHAAAAPHNANCINAEEAQYVVAERQASAAARYNTPPPIPNFQAPGNRWALPFAAQQCALMVQMHRPPDFLTAAGCDSVWSGGIH